MESIPDQSGILSINSTLTCFTQQAHYSDSMYIKTLWSDVGFEPTLPQLTLRGRSCNEHGHRAEALNGAIPQSFVLNYHYSQNFGEDSVSVQTFLGLCQCRMFHKKLQTFLKILRSTSTKQADLRTMFYRVFDIVLSISNLIFPIANILEKVVIYNKHEEEMPMVIQLFECLSMSTLLYSIT